jgi:hypothetical protein
LRCDKDLRKRLELGFDYAISIDSDGQHFADDLPVFIHALDANPQSLLIGERNMNQACVPGKSNFRQKLFQLLVLV